MTLLSDAVVALADTLSTATGETVTYASGVDSAALTMVRGETQFDEYDAVGHGFTGLTVDWLIKATSLILVTNPQLPQLNDTIVNAGGDTYTVIQPAGDRFYRYTDQTEAMLRIHTVRTS